MAKPARAKESQNDMLSSLRTPVSTRKEKRSLVKTGRQTHRRSHDISWQFHKLQTYPTFSFTVHISQVATHGPSKILRLRIYHPTIPFFRALLRRKGEFFRDRLLQIRIESRRSRRSLQRERVLRQMCGDSYIRSSATKKGRRSKYAPAAWGSREASIFTSFTPSMALTALTALPTAFLTTSRLAVPVFFSKPSPSDERAVSCLGGVL